VSRAQRLTLLALTSAAAVVAMRYRRDLSALVSRYIAETEKKLGRTFDAAGEDSAALAFDEPDELFGRRSETSDDKDG
jgi:hypothetical protein